MDFKFWLCVEEVFQNIQLLRQKIDEAYGTGILSQIDVDKINAEFNQITGIEFNWSSIFARKVNQIMTNASMDAKAEAVSDVASEVLVKDTELIKDFVNDIERSKSPDKPFGEYPKLRTPFDSEENRKSAIVRLIGISAQRSLIDMQKKGRPRIEYFVSKFDKAVQEGKPFVGFGARGEMNDAAKEYWKNNFFGKKPSLPEFVGFLQQFQHHKADQFRAGSALALGRRGRGQSSDDDEGVVSGANIAARPTGSGGELHDLQNRIIQNLQNSLNSLISDKQAGRAVPEARMRHIQNAIKIVPHLHGVEGRGAKTQACAAAGVTGSDCFNAFKEIQNATRRLLGREIVGSEE